MFPGKGHKTSAEVISLPGHQVRACLNFTVENIAIQVSANRGLLLSIKYLTKKKKKLVLVTHVAKALGPIVTLSQARFPAPFPVVSKEAVP